MTAIWRGEVEMRWEGEKLMLGALMIGNVTPEYPEGGFITWILTSTGSYRSGTTTHPTEQFAKDALVAATVRALGND